MIMRVIARYSIFILQIIILIMSDLLFIFFKKKKYNAVFGVTEVAGFLSKFGAMDNSYFTVSLYNDNYFDCSYSFKNTKNRVLRRLFILFYAPFLLGSLINKSEVFFYLYSYGFLIDPSKSRFFEFMYLKFRKKKIINYYLGSDIRSIKMLYLYGLQIGYDTIATYTRYSKYDINDEITKSKLAKSSDKFADVIFTFKVDQMSYIKSKTYPGFYILDQFDYNYTPSKFLNVMNNPIKVIHAPTNPLIKGTQVIRATIKKLQVEGYFIDYIELFETSNSFVIKAMSNAHIGINQLYSFVPSVFGIECMANRVALITAADEKIEEDLPIGSNEAWVVTGYWNLYDQLKYLLDNPTKIEEQANKGFDFVKSNYDMNIIKDKISDIISWEK
jgi:hypothetical protein